MALSFCGTSFPKDEFFNIYKWIEKSKDKLSLLTTNKKLYQYIPHLENDRTIVCRYLYNNYGSLNDEEFVAPLYLKSISFDVVELKCGDPSFPLQVQFLVFSRFFRLGHLQPTLSLMIDSENKPNDGEIDALLKKMDEKDPILNAIKSLELCFFRINDSFDLICNKLPNLEHFFIRPIVELKMEEDVRRRYNTLFSERNLTFRCDTALFRQSSPEEYEKNGAYISSFMGSTFKGVQPNRVFFSSSEKGHIFGFHRKEV